MISNPLRVVVDPLLVGYRPQPRPTRRWSPASAAGCVVPGPGSTRAMGPLSAPAQGRSPQVVPSSPAPTLKRVSTRVAASEGEDPAQALRSVPRRPARRRRAARFVVVARQGWFACAGRSSTNLRTRSSFDCARGASSRSRSPSSRGQPLPRLRLRPPRRPAGSRQLIALQGPRQNASASGPARSAVSRPIPRRSRRLQERRVGAVSTRPGRPRAAGRGGHCRTSAVRRPLVCRGALPPRRLAQRPAARGRDLDLLPRRAPRPGSGRWRARRPRWPRRPAGTPPAACSCDWEAVGLRDAGVADQPVSQTKVCDTGADRGAPSSSFRSRCVRSRRRSPCPPSGRRASSSSATRAAAICFGVLRSPGAGGVNVLVRSASRPAAVGRTSGSTLRPVAAAPVPDRLEGGETGVREPHGRARRRRPSPPPGPVGDRLGRDGCSGRAELEGHQELPPRGGLTDCPLIPTQAFPPPRGPRLEGVWSTGARATRALGSCNGSRLVGRPGRPAAGSAGTGRGSQEFSRPLFGFRRSVAL